MIPEIFVKGGPLMYILLGCSILSVSLFFERYYHFQRAQLCWEVFMKNLREKIRNSLFMEAITLCSQAPGPVAAVLKSGLLKRESGRERIKEAMEDTVVHEFSRLERGIPLIAMISHISPLFGLLGTVLGMIECFSVIQHKAGVVNPADLAGGISEALLTTAAGLVVAIPSYMAYSYLVSRIETCTVQVEKSSAELLELLEDSQKTFRA